MTSIKHELITNKIIDLSIYRTRGSLRMLWNSKYSDDMTILKLNKCVDYTFENDQKLFMDCLLLNIPEKHCLVNIIIPKEQDIKFDKKINNANIKHDIDLKFINKDNCISIDILKQYVDLFSDARRDNYDSWIKVGMAIFTCNPTEEGFKLWNEWSSKSSSYCSRICKYSWSKFRIYNYGLGSIRFWSKEDNPEKYKSIACPQEKQLYESTVIEKDYLLDKDDIISKKNNCVTRNIHKWLTTKDIKTLAIKSPYDTGKTTLLKSIISQYKHKRILFITYRQTLAYDIEGNFKQFNFANYLDNIYHNDRQICQIESLFKLTSDYFPMDDIREVPSYDLVICDEIESILAHFQSNTISNKEELFDFMTDIIKNSNKLIVMDGDFGNRAYEYIAALGKSIILENKVKKNSKLFIFSNNRPLFDKKIIEDLAAGKKIVIVSMSASVCLYYYRKFSLDYIKDNTDPDIDLPVDIDDYTDGNDKKDIKPDDKPEDNKLKEAILDDKPEDKLEDKPEDKPEDNKLKEAILDDKPKKSNHDSTYNKYKVIIHCAKTSDSIKNNLKDVTNYWSTPDILIYSPSITAGVNFDVDYYDKMYVVLSTMSCSPRDLLQMIARVRKYKSDEIFIFTNSIKYFNISNFYTYFEVESYIKELYAKYFKPKKIINENDKIAYSYKFGVYEKMIVYNETENLNKKPIYFISYLIKLLTEKGHEFCFRDKDDKTKTEKLQKEEIGKEDLKSIPDVSSDDYDKCMKRQKANTATTEDKLKIEKYILKRLLGVKELTNDMIDKYYGKNEIIKNYKYLLNPEELNNIYADDDNPILDHDKIKKKEQRDMIVEVINTLGFTGVTDTKHIDRETFLNNVEKVKTTCRLFTDIKYSQPLFGYDKNKIKNVLNPQPKKKKVKKVVPEVEIEIIDTKQDGEKQEVKQDGTPEVKKTDEVKEKIEDIKIEIGPEEDIKDEKKVEDKKPVKKAPRKRAAKKKTSKKKKQKSKKGKPEKKISLKSFMGFLNSIFFNFGFWIESMQDNKKIDGNKINKYRIYTFVDKNLVNL
jgi:hypothetical protein